MSVSDIRNLFSNAKSLPEEQRQVLAAALKNYVETSPQDIAALASIVDEGVMQVARALRSEDRATAMAFFNLNCDNTSSIWRGLDKILPYRKRGGRIADVVEHLSILLGFMMFAEDKALDEEIAKDEAAEIAEKQKKASAEAGLAFSAEMEAR